MTPLSLETVLRFRALPANEAWKLLRQSHATSISDSTRCSVDGRSCAVGEVAKVIEASDRDHFGVEVGDAEITYGHAGSFGVSLVHIDGCVADEPDAEAWIQPFLGLPAFLQARLYDREYEFWQNAQDPIEYEAKGRSYSHLPMRSNGAPAPLEQLVIDVSGNPGRRILRRGFVEAVSAVMWLGPSFWAATGANKEALGSGRWLQCNELPGGIVRIKAADTPFTASNSETGQIQERLRSLLFPLSSPEASGNDAETHTPS